MKLHHIPGSRSCRVRWLLEELGLEYEIESHSVGGQSLRSPSYRANHPLGLVPALEDGETVLYESGAILQYILERYGEGRLEPRIDDPGRAAYLQWFHFGEAALMGPLTEIMRNRFVLKEEQRSERTLENARQRFARSVTVLGKAARGVDYLVADRFSAADIMAGFGLYLSQRVGELPEDAESARQYVEGLSQRPAFERAFEGGF
jgi:glutathione S-transferase